MEFGRRRARDARAWWIDAAFLAAVALLGAWTYLAAIPLVTFSPDNFICEMNREGGLIHFFSLYPPKNAGRFLAGSPYVAASWLPLPGMDALGWVHFGGYLLSVLFLALTLREIGLPRAAWVFAAVVRLFNGTNFEIWALNGVGIYSSEAFFWLAAWLYARRQGGGLRAPGWSAAALAVTVLALLIPLGNYHGGWLLVLAWPVGVWLLLPPERRRAGSWMWVGAWYAAILVITVPQAVFTLLAPPEVRGAGGWMANFLGGLADTFWNVLRTVIVRTWEVFTYPAAYGSPVMVVLGAVIVAGFLLTRWDPRPVVVGRGWRVEPWLMLAAVVLAVLVIAPMSARYESQFGSRTVHYASMATFLFYGAGLAWLVRAVLRGWFWPQWTVLLTAALWVAVGTSSYIFEIGRCVTEHGAQDRVFWQRLAELAPRLEPGTVIVYDGGVRTENMNETLATMLLRAITGDDSVFLLVADGPDQVTEPDPAHYGVPTLLDLTASPLRVDDPNLGWINPCHWPPGLGVGAPVVTAVPKNRVLWLTGYGTPEAIRFVPERSNIQRVRPGPSTGFMERLVGP